MTTSSRPQLSVYGVGIQASFGQPGLFWASFSRVAKLGNCVFVVTSTHFSYRWKKSIYTKAKQRRETAVPGDMGLWLPSSVFGMLLPAL